MPIDALIGVASVYPYITSKGQLDILAICDYCFQTLELRIILFKITQLFTIAINVKTYWR